MQEQLFSMPLYFRRKETYEYLVEGSVTKTVSLDSAGKPVEPANCVAKDASVSNKAQTVNVISLETKVLVDSTKTNVAPADEKVDVTDTVTLHNLVAGTKFTLVGKVSDGENMLTEDVHQTDTVTLDGLTKGERFTLKGVVYNKSTRKPMLVDGKQVTNSIDFTAKGNSEEVALKYQYNGLKSDAYHKDKNDDLVSFVYLYKDGILIDKEEDFDSFDQTIKLPSCGTSASDGITKLHVGYATALVDWWDSNYGMTNSLCNFMYGTKGVEYVKSGYVVPSMVVLRTSAIKDNTISSIFTSNGFQPDATTKKYCESSTKWWKKYYGNCMSTDYLNALANQTRTIKFYDGKKSGSGMDYESKFYVTDSGIVYESVGADDRITYKDKSLRIKTRTSSQVTINKDTVFSYGGNEWIFLGTTADGSKYKIIPNFTVAAFNVATVGSSSGELYQSAANANVSDSWNMTVNNVDKLYSRYFSDSMTCGTQMTWNDHPAATDLFGYSKSLTDKDFYYVYGNTIVTADGVAKAKAQGNSIKMLSNSSGNSSGGLLSVIDGKHLRICPILYLDTDKYSFYSVSGDFHLVEGNIAKTLNLNNIFTVGLSKSVSDSIVAKYTNTVELNSLVQGQKVIIGDIVYTCKNDSTGNVCFVSDPITDTALVSSLVSSADNNDNDAIKSKIVALFVGQKVQYGGLSYNLGSFIEDAKIGDKIADGADKLLYCSGKSYYVYSNGTSYSDLTRSCTSVVIQLKFSNGLLVMPLTSKLADYTLLYRSTISGNDKLDDIPFYGENLSYTSEGDYDLTLGKSKYRISQFYRETKDNFKKMMKDAFAGDLINFIWAIIFYFASYVTIILWVLYVILHYGIGLKILQVVSLPVGKDRVFRRGFDIVKILSLGIYDLDSDPSLARTVITSFCSFVVAFAIVAWIPH